MTAGDSVDKPLHVMVAEAIGWRRVQFGPIQALFSGRLVSVPASHGWSGEEPDCAAPGRLCTIAIPRYDTDWKATGPLIEQLAGEGWIFVLQRDNGREWLVHRSDIGHLKPHQTHEATGETPLVAICNLILALRV